MATKLEIFNDWVQKNNKKIMKMIEVGSYSVPWVQEEFRKMRVWIIGNPKKAPQVNICRFISSWLIRGRNQEIQPKNPITKEQEDKHYAEHRRTGPNNEGFTKIKI